MLKPPRERLAIYALLNSMRERDGGEIAREERKISQASLSGVGRGGRKLLRIKTQSNIAISIRKEKIHKKKRG